MTTLRRTVAVVALVLWAIVMVGILAFAVWYAYSSYDIFDTQHNQQEDSSCDDSSVLPS